MRHEGAGNIFSNYELLMTNYLYTVECKRRYTVISYRKYN